MYLMIWPTKCQAFQFHAVKPTYVQLAQNTAARSVLYWRQTLNAETVELQVIPCHYCNQSINQSMNQSINQSMNQSINQSKLLEWSKQLTIAMYSHTKSTTLPSVLWRCWLGGRKGIRCVKTEWWGTGVVVIYLEWGANDLYMVQLCYCHPIISCFIKIQNGSPFWCQLTQIVLEKKLLNGCSSSSKCTT